MKKLVKEKNKWGILPFLLSPLLIIVLLIVLNSFPANRYAGFYRAFIPKAGIFLSLLSVFIGHLSYPRIHNLKVYLLGYLTGVAGSAYFILVSEVFGETWKSTRAGFSDWLFLLVLMNIILVCALPSYIKYRWTKRVTLITVVSEAFLIYLLAFHLELSGIIRAVKSLGFGPDSNIIGITVFTAVVILSLVLIRQQFYLGGVIAGCALLYTAGWYSGFFSSTPEIFQNLVFAAFPLYLQAGVLIHWILCMGHRGDYDPLLHIYNRNFCDRIISERSKVNTAAPLSVAMVDIDHFKRVNDTRGHQAGDVVLHNTAQVITREVLPRGIVCRYGGEEIIIFLPKKNLKEAEKLMEKVRRAVQKAKAKSGRRNLQVTVSIGVSQRTTSSQRIADVIKAADKALYRAKKGGRNKVKTGKASMRNKH
jgi:diguanylate cyclase (GGDEF)-like protein